AVRAAKLLTPQSSLNGMVSGRWRDGFNQHDRGIAQVGYIRRRGSADLNVGYQVHFFRNGQPGVEHRLWQQVRRRFQFLNGALDVSGRIEERFLPANRQHERVRLSNRWIKPLPNAFTLQLGYDWMYNLSDLSRNTQRGVAQNRVVLILQRPVQSARNVACEYQVGYSRSQNAVPSLQHQLRVRYSLNL